MPPIQLQKSSLRLISPIYCAPKLPIHHATHRSTNLLSSYSPSHTITTTTSTKSISTTTSKRPTCQPPPPPHHHLSSPSLHQQQIRSAHHASEGRANRGSRGAGKRLGAKKSALAPVVPGNIIFRQRGTLWFPGENCGIGRDHTIFAREKGFVVYYRIPWRNTRGERKMIGVVFERGQKLPLQPGEQRRRRLGMLGRQRDTTTTMIEGGDGEDTVAAALGEEEGGPHLLPDTEKPTAALPTTITTTPPKPKIYIPPPPLKGKMPTETPRVPFRIPPTDLALKQGYMYRESNASIGRSADRAGLSWRHPMSRTKFMRWRKQKEQQGKQGRLMALAAASASAKKEKDKRKGKGKKGKKEAA